jgi:hypothetical protein
MNKKKTKIVIFSSFTKLATKKNTFIKKKSTDSVVFRIPYDVYVRTHFRLKKNYKNKKKSTKWCWICFHLAS